MITVTRKITFIRRIVQILMFMFVFYGAYLFGLKHINVKWYSVQSGKPGAVELYYNNPTHTQPIQTFLPSRSCRFAGNTGTFKACLMWFLSDTLAWFPPFKTILPHLVLLLFLIILLARFWCGWLCPVGFMSEILTEIRKATGIARERLPRFVRNSFKTAGITLLALLLSTSLLVASPMVPWSIKKPLYLATCQICPSRIVTPLITGFPLMINLNFKSSSTVLLVTLFVLCMLFLLLYLFSFIFKRVWCKVCPGGVVLSFFNKGSLITKEKDSKKCTRCGICANCCPMETTHVYDEKSKVSVDHRECIQCYRCVDLCPENDCLKVKFAGKEIFKS